MALAVLVGVASPVWGQARRPAARPSPGGAAWHKPLITRAPDNLDEAATGEPGTIHADPEPQRVAPPTIPRKEPEPWRPPLVARAGAPLWADTVREAAEFQAVARVKAYESIGVHNALIDARVKAVLTRVGTLRADSGSTDTELLDALRQLIVQGSADPEVRASFAAQLAASSGPATALAPLEEAASAMRRSRYGAYLKAEALADLAAATTTTGARDKALPLVREAADDYFIAITGSGEPRIPSAHALALLSARIADEFPPEVTRSLCDRLRDASADRWLVSMLWGRYYTRLAWDAVGPGSGSRAGVEAFKMNQVKARDWYEDAYRINPGNPSPAADLIAIARLGLGRPDQDLKYWFDRAVDAQLDYPPTFTNTLAALRPRSGGDYAAMLGFGLSCAKSERYDTIVPFQLVQSALDICDDMQDYHKPWTFPKVYEISKQVLTRYTRSNPQHATYYRALLAGIAWRAGQYADAQLLLDALGPKADLTPVRAVHALPRDMLEDLAAHNGPAAEIYRKADEAAAAGDRTAVRALYEQAVEVCKSSPAPLASAATARLAQAQFQESFQSGKWTDLRFDAGLPLWDTVRGSWKPVNELSIAAEPGGAGGSPALALREAVGMRLEVQGTITFSAVNESSLIGAGFGLGFDPFDAGEPTWTGVSLFPVSKTVGLSMGWGLEGDHAMMPSTGAYSFDAVCYDGIVHMTVNGQPAYSGPMTLSAGWDPGERLVIGARAGGPAGPVTFSGLRLRKLLDDPFSAPAPVRAGRRK